VNDFDPAARLASVGRSWTPQQRLHVGDIAWAAARGDGSPVPDVRLGWGDPLVGFADVWLSAVPGEPAQALMHLGPDATPAQRSAAVDDLLQVAPRVTVEAAPRDPVLAARGFRPAGGPWFVQLWRSLHDLSDLAADDTGDGYVIRPVRPDELAARVAVHRRCWAPARIKKLLGLPLTGAEPGSGYSADRHRAVTASPVYRGELDLVAVAPDGSFAAFGLGWLAPESSSMLFEPVGTDPGHARRGLARALCSRMLRAARDLGATQAVVSPRGDDGYPLPRRLYTGLGMREVARFVPLISPAAETSDDRSAGRGALGVLDDRRDDPGPELPGQVVSHAVDHHQLGTRDGGGGRLAPADRDERIVGAVNDQRGRGDLAQRGGAVG
jgi:GNAT superfamily N-acetyltransferase